MKVKELMVYIYKLPVSEGRPSLRWVQTGRWYYLRRESSLRFRNAIGYLNRVECPMTEYEKGYLVLKISPVKEKLIVMVPDLIYDAIITPTKIEGIWEQLWTISTEKPDEKLLALWLIGRQSKSTQNLKNVKELYKKLLEELSKERSKEVSKGG
jgi:hypothetical protein